MQVLKLRTLKTSQTLNLRQIQDALKATAEVNDWTRDLQGSFEQFGGKVDV